MQTDTERNRLPRAEKALLPMGLNVIYLKKLPAISVNNKLNVYNKKFCFDTLQPVASDKPISKILT